MEVKSGRTVEATEQFQCAQNFSRAREIACLQRVFEKRKLAFALEKFSELIADGDVFEVFNQQGQQIYRSWSFFRFCSYSSIDLVFYDWNELFVRPKWIESHLRELFPFFFLPRAGLLKYDLPEHMIYERYGDPNRILLIKMKYASPLLDASTGEPRGFITTGRIRELRCQIGDGVISMI